MSFQSSQQSIIKSSLTVESLQLIGKWLKRFNISLITETALVITVVILAIKISSADFFSEAQWLIKPGILVAAALIPIAIRKSEFPKIGLSTKHIGSTVLVVCQTCIVVFSALFVGLWLLKYFGLGLPLQPVQPKEQGWISWLFYQFMYVAVAEEVFFRGYVQSNLLRLISPSKSSQHLWKWLVILLSAACFAFVHIMIQGKVIFALTFIPGLILAWLFSRTKTLLAPILFHGLANTCYCIMAPTFA
jgi:membrane protease YdiL (CAAX protease family)